jgi:hypothetical protein
MKKACKNTKKTPKYTTLGTDNKDDKVREIFGEQNEHS